jgi:hypothetical protein
MSEVIEMMLAEARGRLVCYPDWGRTRSGPSSRQSEIDRHAAEMAIEWRRGLDAVCRRHHLGKAARRWLDREARESALRHLDTGCGAIEDVEDYIEGVFLNPMMVVHA